jgi:hypothetical protein
MKPTYLKILTALRKQNMTVGSIEKILNSRINTNEALGEMKGLGWVEFHAHDKVEITLDGITAAMEYKPPMKVPPRRVHVMEGTYVPTTPIHRNDGNRHIKSKGF